MFPLPLVGVGGGIYVPGASPVTSGASLRPLLVFSVIALSLWAASPARPLPPAKKESRAE